MRNRIKGLSVVGNANFGTVNGDMSSHINGFSGDGVLPHENSEVAASASVTVFISHSHQDQQLVQALVETLVHGIDGLSLGQIRCSSVPSLAMPYGRRLEDGLHQDLVSAKIIVGLLTPHARLSEYVPAELGAAWGSAADLLLACAGISAKLPGPYANYVACDATSLAEVLRLVSRASQILGIPLSEPAQFIAQAQNFVEEALAISSADN